MRMDFRRKLALFVAGCLVLGSIQLTGITVQASQDGGDAVTYADDAAPGTVTDGNSVTSGDNTGSGNQGSTGEENSSTEVTYRMSDLQLGTNYYDNVKITPNESKGIQFQFTEQYTQVNYAIPQAVKDAGLIKITCNITSSSAASLSLKLLDGDKKDDGRNIVSYGQTSLSVGEGGAEGTEYIGLMSTLEKGQYDITVSSIRFTVSKPVANPPVYEEEPDTEEGETYAAEDLKAYGRYSNAPVALTDGKMVLTFTQQYEEFCLDLPKALDMSNCESITIRTADQNGVLCFKVYDSAKNVLNLYYDNSGQDEYTFTPDFTGIAACIGVMSNSDKDTYPYTAQIVSISFKMKDAPADDEPSSNKVYPAETLKAHGRWSDKQVELTDGKLVLSYNKQWDEYSLDLPEALNMSNCENITIKTADQNVTLAFKIYDSFDSQKDEVGVSYGNSGKDEYSFVPGFNGKIVRIGIMSMDENEIKTDETEEKNDAYASPRTVQIVSIEFTMNGTSEEIPLGDNLIKNPNFADEDNLAVWGAEQGDSSITAEVAEEAIFDEIKTYGKITNRGSNYNCFAQDITDVVKKNTEYQYTFYVMLDADDYKDAEAEMRTVQMAPFIVSDDKPNYSCNLTGDTQKVLEPGVWTKFSGTFTPSWTGELNRIVMRILEQGTDYGSGPGVKGTYYATGVELREMIMPEKEIQQDVPDLKDAVTEEMGNDFLMGVSIVNSELSDDLLMQLVTKHFNAVTLGNELKPDAMFGYSNNECPGTETVTLNGKELVVPTLDYSRAEKTLDAIYDWNQEHPDDIIKIRGHVLVWHSQTPEWFFHEDYDAEKPYVDKDTMNLRLEWYIKTMAEHFTGPASKYKDMFYGWDVVNEAVSDSTGTYRSDTEKSSWWAVYHSNEFILNAFTFANKYMPASVELYYNDYNEWFTNKRNGIVQLLKDVKAAEGARIDGMGMQGHYQTGGTPTTEEFEAAAKAYCEVVGQVQITELDMAASSSYDGTKATLEAEYARQAKRYQDIYTSVRRMKEEGYKVGGITIWGVIDKNSWLQSSSSVGGGTDGTKKQCPLLFDDNYQVKPSYWVFVNVEPLTPAIHKLTVVQTGKDSFAHGKEQTYTRNGTTVSFTPVWNDSSVSVQVKVTDTVKDAEDKVTLYLVGADGTIVSAECLRTDAEETEDGYIAVVSKDLDSSLLKAATTLGFDIVVTNGSRKAAYNDTTLSHGVSSEYFAVATLKPYTYIPMGTAVVDGVKENSWDEAVTVPLTIRLGARADAQASLMWDQDYLYVFAEVKDSVLDKTSSQNHEQDSLEIFIDENNNKSAAYEEDDKQYRINYENAHSFNGKKCLEENIQSRAETTEDGYVIEAAIRWTDIEPIANKEIGLELQINDAEGGKRIGTLSWYDESGQGWSSPGVFGTAILKDYITIPDENESLDADALEDIAGQLEELLDDEYAPEEFVAEYAEAFRASVVQNSDSLPQETAGMQKVLERYDALLEKAAGSSVTVNSTDDRIPAGTAISGALLSVPAGEEATLRISKMGEDGLPGLADYSNICAFDVKLLLGAKELTLMTPVVLSIPIPVGMSPDSLIVLHYEDGNNAAPKKVEANCVDGKVMFTAEHFSTFAIVSTAPAVPDDPQAPETPDDPQVPDVPDVPQNPSTPVAPSAPSAGSQSGSYNITANWIQITADLRKELSVLKPDATEINMLTALTGRGIIVPANVLQMLEGKRLTLNMSTGENLSFSICGLNIPHAIVNRDLDLSVSQNRSAIPAAVIGNTCKDAITYRQISMVNRGNFGMAVNMHLAMGRENFGKYANLYRYDAQTGKLLYAGSFQITDKGQAMFVIRRGADYLVTVTDTRPNDGYTVVKGDTLSRIASRYGLRLRDVLEANPQIVNKNRIFVGEKIKLP